MSNAITGTGRWPTRPRYLVAAIVVAAAVGAMSTPGPAAAAKPERQVKEVTFNDVQLRQLAKPLAAAGVSKEARGQAAAHLDQQMRAGRLVDSVNLRVAEIQNPFRAGNKLTLVSEGSTVATKIDYVESSQGDDDVVTAAGVQTTEDESAGAANAAAYGGGYLGGVNPTNMTTYYNSKYNEGCSTFYFGTGTPQHLMSSCWEKWRDKSNARQYIYNRWMLFTVAFKPNWLGHGWYLKDLTIRSRQWKGYDRIQQMGDWQPASGNTSCSDSASFTLSYSGASLAIPIKKCTNHTVLVDTTPLVSLIGLDRDGSGADSQYRLDAAAKFIARSTTVVPVWADYNWATVQFCTSFITCDPDYSYVQKESGW